MDLPSQNPSFTASQVRELAPIFYDKAIKVSDSLPISQGSKLNLTMLQHRFIRYPRYPTPDFRICSRDLDHVDRCSYIIAQGHLA